MKNILLRTLGLTLIAVLITGIMYSSIQTNFDKEVVLIIGALSLFAAIPVIIGYMIANRSLRSYDRTLVGVTLILFGVDGLLILLATGLTALISFEDPIVLVSIPFLIAGIYIYYETFKLVRQRPNATIQNASESDLLDDFLLDDD